MKKYNDEKYRKRFIIYQTLKHREILSLISAKTLKLGNYKGHIYRRRIDHLCLPQFVNPFI